MVKSPNDPRTRWIMQAIGQGVRLAFNPKVPRPIVQALLNRLGNIAPPAPQVALSEHKLDNLAYDFWTPENLIPGRLLIYSHGGGYTLFSHKTHRTLVSRLAHEFRAQALVYDYRLAPEHIFPAPVEDALSVYRFVLSLGYDPKNIIVAGDSAGGGLTFALLLAARDQGLPLPGLAVGLSPWVDLTFSGKSFTENAPKDVMLSPKGTRHFKEIYLKGADAKHPYASPLFGNLKHFPPVMLQAADDEILRDDAVNFAEAIKKAGGKVSLDIWPGLFHVFEFAWRFLPQAEKAIVRLGDFVREHFDNASKG